jgi:hypothetical protein
MGLMALILDDCRTWPGMEKSGNGRPADEPEYLGADN